MSCFSLLKDRHAWPGADGRRREDHDAEWGHVWHLHGHRYGNPLLRRPRTDQLDKTTPQLWDSSSSWCARCCHTLNQQISFVNKVHIYQMFFRVDIPLCDAWSWQTLKRKRSQREIFASALLPFTELISFPMYFLSDCFIIVTKWLQTDALKLHVWLSHKTVKHRAPQHQPLCLKLFFFFRYSSMNWFLHCR